jgi:hypothetical protein
MGIKRVVIITLIIILLLGSSIYFIITSYGKGNIVYNISDFNLYKNDFQTIADKMLNVKSSLDLSDYRTVWVAYENNQMVCKLDGQKLEMTDKEKQALNNVNSAFTNDSTTVLNRISVYENRVTFCTEGNWYAVAYMSDGSKPKFMSAPKEHFDIKIKKIDRNWYHIYSN